MNFFAKLFSKKGSMDHRRFHRVRTGCLIKYRIHGEQEVKEPWLINAKDISEGGMMLTTFEWLVPGTALDVTINISDYPKPITVFSKLMWCHKVKGTKCYRAGVAFLELPKEDRDAITAHVALVDRIVAHEKKRRWSL